MKKTKIILIGVVAFFSLLIILPFLISVQTYLNETERFATERLGVPVTIVSGHFVFLPSPRVTANEITIGKEQEVRIEQIDIVPTLRSLFYETKVIHLKVNKPI